MLELSELLDPHKFPYKTLSSLQEEVGTQQKAKGL